MIAVSTRNYFVGLLILACSGAAGAEDKTNPKKPADAIKEVAGSAEFLRQIPKKFGSVKAVDPAKATITLALDGDAEPTTWSFTPEAEFKVRGWWGRLEQFQPGARVWAWFSADRAKKPRAIFMLADEWSEKEVHELAKTGAKPAKNPEADKLEAARMEQKGWLRQRWLKEGLPGTVGFLHVYSGETDVILDHEAMRWARSLTTGDKVELVGAAPVKAVVKNVQAQREKTQVRLVIQSFDLNDFTTGQRVHLKMTPPSAEIEAALVPPDIDRPKTKDEKIEWFLANIYCTCPVGGDGCTGHFYTLASCNPNACGLPNVTRKQLAKMIDDGKSNRQIFEELLEQRGPALLRPHLLK